MRRILSILLPLLFATLLFARSGMLHAPEEQQTEKKIVHLKSDNSGPVKPGDSVVFMVGNFAAQHNGAVITADSAVRYSDAHIECFGNVLINKNTTYIYGDRASYDRNENLVVIYSPLVKVVDGDATLYTREFIFNTRDNIGEFGRGGVLLNGANVVEAQHGYYYADTKELIAVDRVEMRNEEYDLKGDSVVYNMASDNAFFFDRTNIWNIDGDYLYGDRGAYSKAESRYMVTRNGYLLTPTQELWSDTLDYYRAEEHVILRSNLQIDETEHKNLSFGDYGEYWKASGKGFLTKNPSIINYDPEQNPDSIFMRSDSIYLYTLRLGDPIPNEYALAAADTLAKEEEMTEATASEEEEEDEQAEEEELTEEERLEASADEHRAPNRFTPSIEQDRPAVDSLPSMADTLAVDTLAQPLPDSLAADSVQLTPAEQRALEKQQQKEEAKRIAAEKRAAKAAAKKELLAKIAVERQAKITAKLQEQERRDSIAREKQLAKMRAKMNARYRKMLSKGKIQPFDTTILRTFELRTVADVHTLDSLLAHTLDSLDSVRLARLAAAAALDSIPKDSIYRLVKGFRNVRIFRTDFQAVCDSLTGLSSDSTLHLYIEPVLWNQNNQITSEVMDIYTANQQLLRAEFVGTPMMASQFDTIYYDQIAGKEMAAHFRENEIYRVDVNGNVQTIFCQKDGWPEEVVGIAVIESGDASFYIEQRQIEKIVYRVNPICPLYPVDNLPAEVSLYLKGFKWVGDRRPERNDVFDRTIRPSERTMREGLHRPDFPIRRRIDEERQQLTEEGRWADRNELVDPATVEWMRSLGYEVGQPRNSEPPQEEPDDLPLQTPKKALLAPLEEPLRVEERR